jgi:hypothetical protein
VTPERRALGVRLALVTLLLALGSFGALGAQAVAATSPPAGIPHLKGTRYCGRIYRADDYTLYTFAGGVSCAYANRFAHHCAGSTSLQGWRLAASGTDGFILHRHRGTLDLQSAGGTPTCLTHASG